jgi:GTP cyclohydrolase I
MKPNNANDNYFLTPERRQEVKAGISSHFRAILELMGVDVDNDPNSKGTPDRVAKMFVDEIYSGRFDPEPKITVFPNTAKVDQLVVTGPLTVKSMCSHHHCAIVGSAWIGYLPGDHVLGLSKFPRILDWYCRRPQIQEELTESVANKLQELINPRGLGVLIKAKHFCQSHRGVNESQDSVMTTHVLKGEMRTVASLKTEFLNTVYHS